MKEIKNTVLKRFLIEDFAKEYGSEERTYFQLRPWQLSDIPSLALYLNNKKIWDNCRDRLPFPYTEEDARSFIDYAMNTQEPCEYCIDINGEAAGNISFMRERMWSASMPK